MFTFRRSMVAQVAGAGVLLAALAGCSGAAQPADSSTEVAGPAVPAQEQDPTVSVVDGVDFTTLTKDAYLERYDDLAWEAIDRFGDAPLALRLGPEQGVGRTDMFLAPSGESSVTVEADDGTWVTNCTAPEPKTGITCYQQHDGEGPWELLLDPDPESARYADWNRVDAQMDFLFQQVRDVIVNAEEYDIPISYSYAEQDGAQYLKVTAERYGQSGVAGTDGTFEESVIYVFSDEGIRRLGETHNADGSFSEVFAQTITPTQDQTVYLPPVSEQVTIDRSGETPVVTPVS